MAAVDPELSSLATTLGELERRLADAAARYEGTGHDDVVTALYDAERSVRTATRSVERAQGML